jgi:hypothetical protein
MAAITNPGTRSTEFAGDYKLCSFYNLSITSASETLTLTWADNGISSIQSAVVCLNAGQDAALMEVACSFSGLVVTITSVGQGGLDATDWTSATVNLIVIGQ